MEAKQTTIRTQAVPNCRFCATEGEQVYSRLRDSVFGVQGEWGMRRCPDCGLYWLDPAPCTEDIGLAYASYYTHSAAVPPPRTLPLPLALARALWRGMTTSVEKLTGLADERRRCACLYLDQLPPGRLFEVGSGNGALLVQLRALGWQVQGIDFDPKAVAVAQAAGLDVQCLDLHDARLAASTYDAVVMSHVIEHLYDPVATLAECRRILVPGGTLVVTTPNIESLGHRRYGRHWRGLEPPRHLHLFSKATLARCAEQAGFTAIALRSTAAHAGGILHATFDIAASSTSTLGINRTHQLNSTLLEYYEHLSTRFGREIGEELVLIARK